MPHVNLLPWREELRKRRQKEFAIMSIAAVLSMLAIIMLVHLYFNGMIGYQQDRNRFLEQEISKLDKKIAEIKKLDNQKTRLIARMQIIQQLQASRPEIVHLFDELVQALPDGVYFTQVVQKDRQLTLNGMAQSNARVSSLMRNLAQSVWLEKPKLIQIKAQDKKVAGTFKLNAFNLRVNQSKPNQGEKKEKAS